MNENNLNGYKHSYLLTTKYIVLKSPVVLIHLKGHLKLMKVLKSYKQKKFIGLRTYAIYTYSFISNLFTTKEKLAILTHHYSYLKEIFAENSLYRVFNKGLLCWSEKTGNDSAKVVLTFNGMLEFEGSLALIFYLNDVMVFRLAFSFVPGSIFHSNEKALIYITCMQGVKNGFKNYAKATKSLNENEPAIVLIKIIEAMAKAININTILCISTTNQICFSSTIGFDKFNNNYNKFWESIGAIDTGKGFYIMHHPFYEKPIGLIVQKHRSRVLNKRKKLATIYNESYNKITSFLKKDEIIETAKA